MAGEKPIVKSESEKVVLCLALGPFTFAFDRCPLNFAFCPLTFEFHVWNSVKRI